MLPGYERDLLYAEPDWATWPFMEAVDAFAGAGGASIGLQRAGFRVSGFDAWKLACDTHNGHGIHAVQLDLSIFNPRIPAYGPWVLWASPPCQPYSAAGVGAGEDDSRDGIPWWLRMVAEMNPPVTIMENVEGLTFEKFAEVRHLIYRTLRGLGYDVQHRVLCAADYGVPQTRRRFILIARRDGGKITWPMPTHTEEAGMFTEKWVSMATALGWTEDVLRTLHSSQTDRAGAEILFDVTDRPAPTVTGEVGRSSQWKVRTGSRSEQGGQEFIPYERDIDRPSPAVIPNASKWNVVAGRDERATTRSIDLPAPTILARKDPNAWTLERPATTVQGDLRVWPPGHNINGDDIEAGRDGNDRAGSMAIRVTLEQLALLQGFPAGMRFRGNRTEQAKQIGNAVPPRLAEVVARANRPIGL